MKKVLWIIPVLLLITGCGKTVKEGKITCTHSSKDVINNYETKSTYVINFVGDYVKSVETEEVVTSESEEILDLFDKQLKETYKSMDSAYGGYKYEIIKGDNQVKSTVTIDYGKMNLKKLSDDQPTFKQFVDGDKIKTEGIKSIYTSLGASCE